VNWWLNITTLTIMPKEIIGVIAKMVTFERVRRGSNNAGKSFVSNVF